jgi:hypothetical protein
MFFARIAAAVVVASILGCGLAHAAGPLRAFKLGFWSGGAYTDDRSGGFTHCSAGVAYDSGINLFVLVTGGYRWWLGFINPHWAFTPDARLPVELRLDRGTPFARVATVPSGQLLLVPLPDNSRLIDRFRRSSQLNLIAEKEAFFFKLSDTSAVMDELTGCVRTSVAFETHAPSAPPPTSASAESETKMAAAGAPALSATPSAAAPPTAASDAPGAAATPQAAVATALPAPETRPSPETTPTSGAGTPPPPAVPPAAALPAPETPASPETPPASASAGSTTPTPSTGPAPTTASPAPETPAPPAAASSTAAAAPQEAHAPPAPATSAFASAAPEIPASPAVATAPSFAPLPQTIQPPQPATATAIEEVRLARDFFTTAQLPNARLVVADKPAALASFTAVWRSDNAAGAVEIIPPGPDVSGIGIASNLIAVDPKICKGNFTTARSSTDVDSNVVFSAVLSCTESNEQRTAQYFITPRRQGGFVVFAVVGSSAAGGTAGSDQQTIDLFTRAAVRAAENGG